MDKHQVEIAGIAWYSADDYPRIREVMLDGANLPDTFGQWETAAHKFEETYQRAGQRVVRAFIRPAEFVGWCRANGLNVDAKARMQWANLAARRAAVPGHG